MSSQAPSTEKEYDALPLGNDKPSFEDFGFAVEADVTALIYSLGLNPTQAIRVRSVWARHPSRLPANNQGIIYHFIVILVILSLSLPLSRHLTLLNAITHFPLALSSLSVVG